MGQEQKERGRKKRRADARGERGKERGKKRERGKIIGTTEKLGERSGMEREGVEEKGEGLREREGGRGGRGRGI